MLPGYIAQKVAMCIITRVENVLYLYSDVSGITFKTAGFNLLSLEAGWVAGVCVSLEVWQSRRLKGYCGALIHIKLTRRQRGLKEASHTYWEMTENIWAP